MKMSYSQNLEDYYLDLVFADKAVGTYIDVGGGHPIADNVSFWFYLKGWRGLVVEPQQDLADIYAAVRPRDTTVACLAGKEEGEIDFFVVEKFHGLSTTVRDHADHSRNFGVEYTSTRRPVRTLTSLCAEANLNQIDFLKIDAEGAEADVLAGMDFTTLRPRVLCLEAEVPGTFPDAWKTWEPTILDQRYELAFIDSLNRWYVAAEASELATRFPKAPVDWHSIGHLWNCGRAADSPEHPDRLLAQTLQQGLYATLTSLPRPLLLMIIEAGLPGDEVSKELFKGLVGTAEYPGPDPMATTLDSLVDTDQFRAAMGRIACMYDGGHIIE